ncbi:phospholipid ABC transporter ATP-binding protein MlaF, partial [Vibrio natriegens]
VYLLSGGKIIGQGSPSELQHNADPRIRQFLDGKADGPVPFKFPAGAIEDELFDVNSKGR